MLNLDDRLVALMRNVAKSMGMSLSEWISFIARDKIDYFLRHKDNYCLPPDNKESEEYKLWEKDIKATIEKAKSLWKH